MSTIAVKKVFVGNSAITIRETNKIRILNYKNIHSVDIQEGRVVINTSSLNNISIKGTLKEVNKVLFLINQKKKF